MTDSKVCPIMTRPIAFNSGVDVDMYTVDCLKARCACWVPVIEGEPDREEDNGHCGLAHG